MEQKPHSSTPAAVKQQDDEMKDETSFLLPHAESCSNDGTSDSNTSSDDERIVIVTYASLWKGHYSFRLLFVAWNLTTLGEWFNYVAALTLLKRIVDDPDRDNTAIAVLVVLWLLPSVVFSSIGGLLADFCDKRKSMMMLDFLAGCLGLLYLTAFDSILLVYMISFFKMTMGALYEPCAASMVPMLVEYNAQELQKATTLQVFMESLLAALGPALGGWALSMWGLTTCFVLDSMLCFSSALLTWMVGGSWDPSHDEEEDDSPTSEDDEKEEELDKSLFCTLCTMAGDGVQYLRQSFFGPLILLKCSSALIYGSIDVLEVSFSEQGSNEHYHSLFLGILFSLAGLGDLLGTVIAEYCTNVKNPSSLQNACVWSFFGMAVAFLGMGMFSEFASPCVFTVVDSASATVIHISSEILLQLYCQPNMLGRVLAMDMTLSTTAEIISALMAGWVQDFFKVSAQTVSLAVSAIGFFVFLSWFVFHYNKHGGAASPQARNHTCHFSKA